MPVSSEYLSALVAELDLAKVNEALDTLVLQKQFALDVANGMCPVCCEWSYCLCDYYIDNGYVD